jgi:hypothetical protein
MTQMPVEEPIETLEKQAAATLQRLRAALAGVIAEIRGEVRRPADLERALKLPHTLAWRVFKFANSRDLLTEASKVPGQFAMNKFLEAAGAAGVPERRIRAVKTSLAAFLEVVENHAGDRDSFDSMLSALASEEETPIDLQYRKTAFQGNSHILGIQAKSQLTCQIFHPSAHDPSLIDFAAVRGLIDLRWLRGDATCVISALRVCTSDGVPLMEDAPKALEDHSSGPDSLGMLREFCSKTLPRIRMTRMPLGFINTEIIGKAVGNQSVATCILGHVMPQVSPRYATPGNDMHRSLGVVRTPTTVLVHDMLIAEGLFGRVDPKAEVYTDHRADNQSIANRACDRLPMQVAVDYLGKGPSAVHTADVPRYEEMLGFAFKRLGWDGEKFDVYRCRVEYPVMPSSVVMQFDLPEAPPPAPEAQAKSRHK